MPRIGRSFPPQWVGPNPVGAQRALGPRPPQPPTPPPVVTTLSVNLATGVLTNQRRAQQRRTQIVRGTPIVETGGVGAISPGSPAALSLTAFGNVPGAPNSISAVAAATGFIPAVNATAISLAVFLSKQNAPTDDALITIQTADGSGNPSGTVLATLSVPAASLTTSQVLFSASFSVSLSAGTQYWIVCSRSGAGSSTNRYQISRTQGGNSSTYPIRAFDGTTWQAATFAAPSYFLVLTAGDTLAAYASTIGPQPPLVIDPVSSAPVVTTLSVNLATGVLTNQRRAQQRFPRQWYEGSETDVGSPRPDASSIIVYPERAVGPDPPAVIDPASTPSPPVVTTITVAAVKTRPRRTTSLYTVALDLFPLAVVTTPGQLAVATHATRTRPRPVRSSLPLTLAAASTFIAPPISVTLQDNRVRGFGRRHFPAVVLNPPTVLRTFAGPDVLLQAIQTRVQRQRRRLPGSFLSPPATLEPETVALAERQIRVTLARIRPRHTLGTRLGYTIYPATSEIAVALIRTRPRPTRHALTAITYPQAGVGFIHLVRVRPRPTSKFVAPPATLQPYSVTVAEDTVRVTAVRARPRATTRHVNPPTVLQVFTGPSAPFVRTRPRPTQRRLTAISYPATSAIRVVLTRTRPRPTSRTLGPLIFYAQTSQIAATLARTRPRRTVATVRPPAITTVAQAFYGPQIQLARIRPRGRVCFLAPPVAVQPGATAPAASVTHARIRPPLTRHLLSAPTVVTTTAAFNGPETPLARTRPRRVASKLAAPVFYAATSDITVAVVRTRPRATRHLLSAISYPQTGVGFQHLARTRPRPTTRFLAPPSTLQPYSVTVAEDTVRVTAVRTRPRHTLGTRLIPPTALRTFAGPSVTLTHTRPRQTLRRLAPPTVIRVPSVEQREDTITVALVHTRPRPTEKFIVPPLVKTFPPVVTTLLPAHLVKTRPRPTTRFLRPPTAVIPLPTLRMQTIAVATVRARPRPTRHSLTPLAFYRQTSKIQVVLARTRPRPTAKRLQPPIFYKQTSEIQVVLARTRPRPTTRILTAVRYEQTSEIAVALTRIRPRPTRHFLAPPTVLQTFGPPVEVEIAVRTPLEDRARRRPRSFTTRPVTYPAKSALAVKLTRTRPRPIHSILRPPTAVRAFVAAPATVTSVRSRPRRTHSFLLPPTAVRTFTAQPIQVATVTTRPRPTTTRIVPPTRLRPVETTLHVKLARTRPRHVRSNLPSVAVVAEPPTVTTLTVVLTQARPRPTRSLLAAPATLRRVVVFTAEPIRVTTVTTRPPRTRAGFTGGPVPELISVCGWTSGEVVAATDSAGSTILVSGTDGGAVPVAATESEVTPVAQSEGEDSATGRTEGMDKLAGT